MAYKQKVLQSNNEKDKDELLAREGVIIECPLNEQYHDRRDVILTSQMAVSNNFITVTVIQNIGQPLFTFDGSLVKST